MGGPDAADAVRQRIAAEKAKLSESARAVLAERRHWVHRYPDDLDPVSDAEFELLSREEQDARRIDFILSKEIEYLLAQRSLPSKLIDWFKRNRRALITSHVFAGFGSAFAYYLEHQDQIDSLVTKLHAGVLSRSEEDAITSPRPFSEMEPDALFERPSTYTSETDYLVEISSRGLESLSADEAEARLAAL